jgi:hypothetical protein
VDGVEAADRLCFDEGDRQVAVSDSRRQERRPGRLIRALGVSALELDLDRVGDRCWPG